jgi:hypothetical protein
MSIDVFIDNMKGPAVFYGVDSIEVCPRTDCIGSYLYNIAIGNCVIEVQNHKFQSIADDTILLYLET